MLFDQFGPFTFVMNYEQKLHWHGIIRESNWYFFLQLSSIAIHSSSIEEILKDIPVWLWSPDWVLSLSPTSGEMQLSYCWNKASGSWYSTSASGRWIWISSDSSLGWYLILPIIKSWYEAHTKPKHQQNKWIPTTELLNGEIIATVLSYPPVPIPRIIE